MPSVLSVDRDAALPRLDRADRGESGMNELHELNIASPTRYACVACGTPLLSTKHSQLKCPSCHAEQPIIHQIPILVSRPDALLKFHADNLNTLEHQAADLERYLAAHPSARAHRALLGMRANLRLTSDYMEPVLDYLSAAGSATPHLNDWISSRNAGWAPQEMLPYFVQDWLPSRDFRRISALIVDALVTYRPDAETLAVLGAGACGLVNECAPQFNEVHAIEMSVPTMFIAQGVLAGDCIEVHLSSAGWRGAKVHGAKSPIRNIKLAVADANCLPFEPGSLSAVVTQYLMDIVANPLGVAAEIAAALKPGGIWVNFSIPFPLPGEPKEISRPALEDLPSLLHPLHFQLISGRRDRFTLLDPTEIDAGAACMNDEVYFFVARKTQAHGGSPTNREKRFNWQSVPRSVPGREVNVIRRSVPTSAQPSEQLEISVGSSQAFTVGADEADLVSDILSLFDGKRTVQEIFDALQATRYRLNPADFKELLFYLTERHGILTTSPQENPAHAGDSATLLSR